MASATLPSPAAGERTFIDRLLRPFADVRAGEGLPVLLLGLNLFLVLFGYYLLKTIRESLILTESGAAVKIYTSAGQAFLLLFMVPAFGAIASKVDRTKLVTWVTLFFVSNVVLFYVVGRARGGLGILFFLWVGIFNVMVTAQFWALANDLYKPEQGKRLFAIVGLGSNVGAWVGSLYAGRFIRAFGPYPLMLVAAGVLASCVVVAWLVNALHRRQETAKDAAEAERPLGKEGGFELIRKDRYLMLLAALLVLINVVNTGGEYLLGRTVEEASLAQFGAGPASLEERQKFVGGFYGDFFGMVNLVSFLGQMFVVSRIMTRFGVGGALLVHPLVALTGYLTMMVSPGLALIKNFKVADNALDYSLNNTAKHALWLPTSREAKYKAKQAVDAFFWRIGDVTAAVVVLIGTRLAFSVPVFAAINATFAVVWFGVSWALGRENLRRVAAAGETP